MEARRKVFCIDENDEAGFKAKRRERRGTKGSAEALKGPLTFTTGPVLALRFLAANLTARLLIGRCFVFPTLRWDAPEHDPRRRAAERRYTLEAVFIDRG